MNHRDLVEWLFTNSGPTIRYRTATELMAPSKNVDVVQLRHELLQSEPVKTWLIRFVPFSRLNDIHGSKATTFESVMGKLTDLGLRRGVAPFDQQTMPYREWLKDNVDRPPKHIFDIFTRTLIAAFLARAGYVDEPAVGKVLRMRLETVYDFARQGRCDVYVNPDSYPKMPKSFKGKRLIDPRLSLDGNLQLPWIYDIVGFSAYLPEYGNETDQERANTVICYILNEQYQRFPEGYGILLAKNRTYYAMGWSVSLPGFVNKLSEDVSTQEVPPWILGAFVQRLAIMGQFSIVRKHPWFINSLNHLEGFETEKGTYLFPRSYLPEKANGYWITGARMGLEDNRNTKLAIELESTFWMAKLKTGCPFDYATISCYA
ncbi:MAG: hypothetical protein A2Z29_05355 [Chloroflexi bacterium RBG_16_56_11]|nr:MAG: hypothetical protein A2Z29_05355 [Chloroflexi bacterium RBG_16_56_11]